MSRRRSIVTILIATAALTGCGSASDGGGGHGATGTARGAAGGASAGVPGAHPQAIAPSAGDGGSAGSAGSAAAGSAGVPDAGDTTARAPSLASVRRQLHRLNLCGGATSAADAAPITSASGPGFVADPGTQQTEGRLPELTARLDALGRSLGVTIYGISGYRSPSHSVAVGGFSDDPHTRGEAEDIGVGSLLRSSAARISSAQLARYGLYRPFDPSDDPSNVEVNHVQLIPRGGPVPLSVVTDTYDPDPSCS